MMLKDKVAVIYGAGGAIGSTLARAFASEGANLFLTGRYLAPVEYWAYKGVKWANRVTVVDRFCAGFWESRLPDPVGRIPEEVELP